MPFVNIIVVRYVQCKNTLPYRQNCIFGFFLQEVICVKANPNSLGTVYYVNKLL